MRVSMYLRNMGPLAASQPLFECTRAAEAAGIDTLWLADHIAIPPDDAEGSGGRYLDPLATAAWLAARTSTIRLGTGVLVLPYRPILPTAKWIATIQELSANRFRLGVGSGWMAAEFRAVGVARHRRGQITDDYLRFLQEAFSRDEIEANGQPMLFLPRPQRPQILIGGGAPHALRRAAVFGDGWMPIGRNPKQLAAEIETLRALFGEAGKGDPEVVLITALAVDEGATRLGDQLEELASIGVNEVVHGWRYGSAGEFADVAASLRAAAR